MSDLRRLENAVAHGFEKATPVAHSHDGVARAMGDAHGAGLRLTGMREMVDELAARLTREIHQSEDEEPDPANPGVALGLRRARAIVRKARP